MSRSTSTLESSYQEMQESAVTDKLFANTLTTMKMRFSPVFMAESSSWQSTGEHHQRLKHDTMCLQRLTTHCAPAFWLPRHLQDARLIRSSERRKYR